MRAIATLLWNRRFSRAALTRNLAYGATCLMAATFIWHGLRHVGHFSSRMKSRCAWLSALKYNSSGSRVANVADDLAVLAEEQPAIRIQHDALRLERAGGEAVIAVRNHVGVVHVDVVLAVEQRIHPHAVEEELAHALLFLAAVRAARRRKLAVAEHRHR